MRPAGGGKIYGPLRGESWREKGKPLFAEEATSSKG